MVQLAKRHKLQVQTETNKHGYVHVATLQQEKASVMVYAKILVSHFQILTQFDIVLDITFPDQELR